MTTDLGAIGTCWESQTWACCGRQPGVCAIRRQAAERQEHAYAGHLSKVLGRPYQEWKVPEWERLQNHHSQGVAVQQSIHAQ